MIKQKFYRLAALASVSLCAFAGAMPAAHAYETVSGGRYGQVTVTKPAGDVRGFVVLYSRENGWSAADQQAADALAKNGAMVVGVDTAKYAANLVSNPAAKKETCHNLVGDAEAVSHQLERQVQSNRYFMPILAGMGQGATLAMQALKQAPENTVAGAVSVAPSHDLDKRFNPCPPDPTITHGPGLPGFAEMDASASAGTQRIVDLTSPHLRAAPMNEEDVSDLPLIELPAAHPNGLMAIVISGDGGWRDLDKTIAEELQKDGVSVIGWDSLRYFWAERSPQQTSHDLARVLQTYSSRWHADHVALIGYSFGADVMPFAYNRLPDAARSKVALISLLGFAPSADFQIRVTGWLGMPASDKALQVKPEFSRLPPKIVQCFYGEHEEDTLCPALTNSGVEVIRTSGDHHFGHDYAALEKRILNALKKQAAGGV
jgi:type IV secretory pathway VirJ component